jgi:hypothetical protein
MRQAPLAVAVCLPGDHHRSSVRSARHQFRDALSRSIALSNIASPDVLCAQPSRTLVV